MSGKDARKSYFSDFKIHTHKPNKIVQDESVELVKSISGS